MSEIMEKMTTVTKYDELLRAVRKTMAEGRARAEKAVEVERVRTYWEAGKLIHEHVLQHKERAGYAEQLLVRLAKDLGMSKTELYYMLEFARAYPIFRHAGKLSWSEHQALLAVNAPKERKALADLAVKENWKRDRLRQEVRKITREMEKEKNPSVAEKVAPKLPAVETLTAEPGKLQTYRVIRAKAGPLKGGLVLDLGFATYVRLSVVTPEKFNEGDVVTADLNVGANDHSPLRAVAGAAAAVLFTYAADIYAVLDGDTVNAVVDLGFGIFTQQTLRLRGIDAPELMSADGREAKEALEKMIAEGSKLRAKNKNSLSSSLSALSSPFLIRTTKSDKYDRYLADIWIPNPNGLVRPRQELDAPVRSVNVYVNQQLVDEGHAVVVED